MAACGLSEPGVVGWGQTGVIGVDCNAKCHGGQDLRLRGGVFPLGDF